MIINIKDKIFKKRFNKVNKKVCNIKDDSCGYSTLICTAHDIYNKDPELAIKILHILDLAINDNKSFIQDDDTTNRIIIECIKTNNVDVLSKKYFKPNVMPTYAIKALFSVLDEFGTDMRNHLLDGNVYGRTAQLFKRAMHEINDCINNYLMKLGVINASYHENHYFKTFTMNLPYYLKMFKSCINKNKWYGFQLIYNIWHLSKYQTSMSFDILLRYMIIGLYLKWCKYTKARPKELSNSTHNLKITSYILNIPKIKMEPYYKNEFNKLVMLNNKLAKMVSTN